MKKARVFYCQHTFYIYFIPFTLPQEALLCFWGRFGTIQSHYSAVKIKFDLHAILKVREVILTLASFSLRVRTQPFVTRLVGRYSKLKKRLFKGAMFSGFFNCTLLWHHNIEIDSLWNKLQIHWCGLWRLHCLPRESEELGEPACYKSCPRRSISSMRKSMSWWVAAGFEMTMRKKLTLSPRGW